MALLPATTFENMVINMRKKIISVTGLDGNMVLNADTMRGAEIMKWVQKNISDSPTTCNDEFIIFEAIERKDEHYGATKKDYQTMEVIAPYTFHLLIYGDGSHTLSQRILANFKNNNVVESLWSNGIKIEGVSQIGTINEFINDTRWIRCDVEIPLLVRYEFVMNDDEKDIYTDENTPVPTIMVNPIKLCRHTLKLYNSSNTWEAYVVVYNSSDEKITSIESFLKNNGATLSATGYTNSSSHKGTITAFWKLSTQTRCVYVKESGENGTFIVSSNSMIVEDSVI